MAKFSYKLTVRYEFSFGTTSRIVKLGHSEAELKLKEDVVYDDLKKLGHKVISSEIVQTKQK